MGLSVSRSFTFSACRSFSCSLGSTIKKSGMAGPDAEECLALMVGMPPSVAFFAPCTGFCRILCMKAHTNPRLCLATSLNRISLYVGDIESLTREAVLLKNPRLIDPVLGADLLCRPGSQNVMSATASESVAVEETAEIWATNSSSGGGASSSARRGGFCCVVCKPWLY